MRKYIASCYRPKWECSCYYISPKGRNRYSSKRQYSLEEMKYYYDKNVEQEEKVCTKEYQRKLMTDSLRYDILKGMALDV